MASPLEMRSKICPTKLDLVGRIPKVVYQNGSENDLAVKFNLLMKFLG